MMGVDEILAVLLQHSVPFVALATARFPLVFMGAITPDHRRGASPALSAFYRFNLFVAAIPMMAFSLFGLYRLFQGQGIEVALVVFASYQIWHWIICRLLFRPIMARNRTGSFAVTLLAIPAMWASAAWIWLSLP